MNSSRLIDISKSSLVGLKAELLKKQEEVKRIKEQKSEPRLVGTSKLKKKSQEKCNKNVEERILKDESNTEEDFDAIKKSREVLEAKARLYDKLKCGSSDSDNKKSQYLIDFDLKQEIENSQKPQEEPSNSMNSVVEEEEDDHYSDVNSDPENDWVDFTDTLGRSKRCLRRDLHEMKAKDVRLAADLKPPSPPPAPPAAAPELLSWDMQREMMRQKWEEQETNLLGKTNIHYQDVLFDENRTHGVGYFEFSTDEEERLRQQEALKKLRKETEEQQQASVGLRARRQQQLQARLAAARRRKRERLGLPPDSPEPPLTEVNLPVEIIEEKQEEDKVADIEEMISRIAPVRPWDIGKKDSNPVMTQEEWVDKKRQERPAEFAPPSTLAVEAAVELSHSVANKSNFFTTKKPNSNKYSNPFNKQDHSFTNRKSSEVQNQANIESETTSSSTVTDPNSAGQDHEKESFIKNYKDTKTREWKPTLADIEKLLEKTKKQTSGLSQTSNSSGFSRDLTSKVPTKKVSEERYQQREKLPFNQYQSTSSVDSPPKIGDIINEVDEDGVLSSTPKNSEANTKRYNKKWAAIPPPAAMSYYTEENARTKPSHKRSGDIADSLSVGMNLLKERSEEKSNKRLKGLLDII